MSDCSLGQADGSPLRPLEEVSEKPEAEQAEKPAAEKPAAEKPAAAATKPADLSDDGGCAAGLAHGSVSCSSWCAGRSLRLRLGPFATPRLGLIAWVRLPQAAAARNRP